VRIRENRGRFRNNPKYCWIIFGAISSAIFGAIASVDATFIPAKSGAICARIEQKHNKIKAKVVRRTTNLL
jgi:hypothetical protein